MTLRWRISLILAGLALAVSAFAAVSAYLATSPQRRSGIDDTLRTRARAANASIGGRGGRGPEGGRPGGPDANECPTTSVFLPASAAQLVDPAGTVTSCLVGGPRLPLSAGDRTLSTGAVSLRTVTISGQDYRLLSTPWHAGGTLQIARSLSESDAVLSRLRLRLLLLLALAAVVP